MNKKCTYCKLDKDISNFGIKKRKLKNNEIKIYHSIYCKSCNNIKIKLWRSSNLEYVKLYNSKLEVKKRKKICNKKRKLYHKQYYLNNIIKIKLYSKSNKFKQIKKIYHKNKRKNDPVFRMRENISNSILRALKNGKSNKAGQSILKYLEYTIEELKIHIQNQFDDKMFWNNYGIYWHIDHIVPQSMLPYITMEDENFKKCWALSNLRPLNAKQNILDGARRTRHKISI